MKANMVSGRSERLKVWWILLLAAVSAGSACKAAGGGRNTAPRIRVGYPSIMGMHDMPSLMALDMLASQGYTVKRTMYAQPELAVEALARGDVEIGFGSTRTYWTAAGKGAPIAAVMEQSANLWSIVAKKEIVQCHDLDARRFAQHSEGSVSKALSDAYLQHNCPKTNPRIVIISSSENRAAALLAGEIDAAPLELADVIRVEHQARGKFHVLVNFARDWPGLKTTAIYVNTHFAAENPALVKDLIRALLNVHRRIAAAPGMLMERAAQYIVVEQELLPEIVKQHIEADAWDRNGGLTEESIRYTLDFFVGVGKLSPGLTSSRVADLSYLKQVLDEIGRK